mgnify:CR=1 FL=1
MAFATIGTRGIQAQSIDLTTKVTGTLPVPNGGLGIASGTTGQFLKFTGTETLASSADNGGGLVLLSNSESSSSASSVIFDNVFTSSYNKYKITGFMIPSGDNRSFRINARTGGASGSTNTASIYNGIYRSRAINSSGSGVTTDEQFYQYTAWNFAENTNLDSNSAYLGFDFTIYDPNTEIAGRMMLSGFTTFHQNSDARQDIAYCGGRLDSDINATGIVFSYNADNVAKHSISVYGVADA